MLHCFFQDAPASNTPDPVGFTDSSLLSAEPPANARTHQHSAQRSSSDVDGRLSKGSADNAKAQGLRRQASELTHAQLPQNAQSVLTPVQGETCMQLHSKDSTLDQDWQRWTALCPVWTGTCAAPHILIAACCADGAIIPIQEC